MDFIAHKRQSTYESPYASSLLEIRFAFPLLLLFLRTTPG